MVILHYKKTDLNQFLYETHCGIPCDDLLKDLCESKLYDLEKPEILSLWQTLLANPLFSNPFIPEHSDLIIIVNNLRLKLDRAAMSLEDLASKGPMKPEELRGLKDYDDYVKNEDITTINGLKKMPPRVGVREVIDDTHYRTGWLLGEEMSKMMLDEAMKTKMIIHVSKVDQKVCLTKQMMTDQLDIIRGLTMMAYPAYHGLGEWEPIKVILENREEFEDKIDLSDDLWADKSSLWICGKEL